MNGLHGFIIIQPADCVYTKYHLKVSVLNSGHAHCVVHLHVLNEILFFVFADYRLVFVVNKTSLHFMVP